MMITYIIFSVLIIGYVSSIFFLRYITKIIAKVRMSLFASAACWVAYSVLSSLFSSFLGSYYECASNTDEIICRMLSSKTAWNFSDWIWQLPIFFLIFIASTRWLARTKISFTRSLMIVVCTMVYANIFGLILIYLHTIE